MCLCCFLNVYLSRQNYPASKAPGLTCISDCIHQMVPLFTDRFHNLAALQMNTV